MANEPIPENPSDDELESLAADLFGVSLTEQSDVEPFDVGEFDLDDDEPTEASAETVEESAPAEEASASMTKPPVPEADDAFGSSLLDGEEPLPAPAAVESDEDADQPSGEVDDESSGSESSDTYWDALDGFDWEEPGEEKKPKVRKEYTETSETFEDLSIESAQKSEDFMDDAEFGAGLDDEVSEPARDEDDSEEPPEKGRRRRGRRRGRRGKSKERSEPTDAEKSSRSDDRARSGAVDDDEPDPSDDVVEADAEDDGFGAGLDVEVSDGDQESDAPKKKRQRRGGRRRGKRKTAERGDSAAETKDRTSDDDGRSEPRQKERSRDKYSSVPTWEEAIGYLVRPTPKKSGEGGKSGSRRGRRGRRRSSS